jgi:hypothetical protein
MYKALIKALQLPYKALPLQTFTDLINAYNQWVLNPSTRTCVEKR